MLSKSDISRLKCLYEVHKGSGVALVPGCFELLHAGHHDLIEAAAREAAIIVVAVPSDAVLAKLKPGRPLIPLAHRLPWLEAHRLVDAVIVYDALTPVAVADLLQPEIVVKGSDWHGKEVPEAKGRRLVIVSRSNGSSSELIDRIRSR